MPYPPNVVPTALFHAMTVWPAPIGRLGREPMPVPRFMRGAA
jgi:hypothetical protein